MASEEPKSCTTGLGKSGRVGPQSASPGKKKARMEKLNGAKSGMSASLSHLQPGHPEGLQVQASPEVVILLLHLPGSCDRHSAGRGQ